MREAIRLEGQPENAQWSSTGAKARRVPHKGSHIQESNFRKTTGPAWRVKRQRDASGNAVIRLGFGRAGWRPGYCGGKQVSDS